jgi:hypothetical protein
MVGYKVNSPQNGQEFVKTQAYHKLYHLFKGLKENKGRIVHVLGAPGTGKSATIYEVINNLELKVYDADLALDDVDVSSSEVLNKFFQTLMKDMNVKDVDEIYIKASQYDAVLFADRFHDSQFLYEDKKGFSIWMDKKGIRTLPFYILLIVHYFQNYSKFKKINIIFQTAWTFRVKGVKYDLFTDFGLFSKLIIQILRIFFEVVEISYSDEEIRDIIKKHRPDADEKEIQLYIKKYGSRIRFILQSLSYVNH